MAHVKKPKKKAAKLPPFMQKADPADKKATAKKKKGK